MKKILLPIAIILIILALYLLLLNKETTVNTNETKFAIENINQIDSIIIQKDTTKIILTKNKNSWRVNHSTTADNKKIIKALNTLKLLEVKSPVPQNAIDIINQKLNNAIKITVFIKKTKKTIFLGEQTAEKNANYAKLNNYKPYVIYIPGKNFNLQLNFKPKINYWQTNEIFHFTPEDITLISIKYYPNQQNSFTLEKKQNNFILLANNTQYQNLNNENIAFYLTHFQDVRYKKIIHDTTSKNLKLFATITIKDKNYNSIKLYAYKIPQNNNQFIAQLKNKWILCNYYDFDLILKDWQYFIKK